MRIVKQNKQRMILGSSFSTWSLQLRLLPILLCMGGIALIIVFLSSVWIGGAIVVELSCVVLLVNLSYRKIILDRSTQNVKIQELLLWMIPLQRHFPLSALTSVLVEHKMINTQEGRRVSIWEVFLYVGGERFRIDHSGYEARMNHLADEIRRFIFTEPPDLLRARDVAKKRTAWKTALERDKVILKWKTRDKKEAEDERRKKQKN